MIEKGAVEYYDSEERCYKDAVSDIKRGTRKIYVYNKNILNKIQKEFDNIEVKKKDFYWEIINNNEPFPKKKDRHKKGV